MYVPDGFVFLDSKNSYPARSSTTTCHTSPPLSTTGTHNISIQLPISRTTPNCKHMKFNIQHHHMTRLHIRTTKSLAKSKRPDSELKHHLRTGLTTQHLLASQQPHITRKKMVLMTMIATWQAHVVQQTLVRTLSKILQLLGQTTLNTNYYLVQASIQVNFNEPKIII